MQIKGLEMTSKTLTFRVPSGLYLRLSTEAAEQGMHLSSYLRLALQREHDETTLAGMRAELLERLEQCFSNMSVGSGNQVEILYLTRAIANHLSPQIIVQVKSRLADDKSGL